ncbi:hypothetical protein BVC80_1183g46 [Macleaya cordata]|uniref:Uncharacterized protein n=1 Tax=Macleaya cordata TaxID=56857 RepID=A0A200PQ62_MACCD|nr:hypothetical protein BVC80_1183g46 [Macleaya cordata]
MAAGNSSSRRKSSSSHKKKTSKISSEVSLSVSSSDSEDDYRSRRARSRTRRDEKGSRKRVRRSSSSPEDSRDSPHRRKKKGSKKSEHSRDSKKKDLKGKDKEVSIARKKTHKVKRTKVRSRREKSVDSVSSGSRSWSTRRGGSSGSEEREFERSRGRSEGREKKGKRSSGKMNKGRDDYRSRSRSCSPFSGYDNESSYCSEERFSRENYSKRIRSVLTVANGSNEAEGRDHYKDDNKAEIIQAYDDCPSCRSNDSYDGGRNKDYSHHTHVVSEKKRKPDDLKVEETFIPKTRTTEFTKSSNEDPKKFEASTRIDSPEGNDLESLLRQKALEKFEASTGIDSSEGNDLESILRQKALENLKKFRGGLHTNVKALGVRSHVSENGVKQPSTAKADTTKTGFHKEGRGVAGSKEMVSQNMKNVGMPLMERKSATLKDDGQILDKNHNQHESRAQPNTTHVVLGTGDSSMDQMVAVKATEKNSTNVGVITNKATQDTSRIKDESSCDHSIVNQTPATQNSPMAELIEPKNIVDKNVADIPNAANGCSNAHVAEISRACESAAPNASSCITPVSGEHGSNEPGDVAKGSSQFEQKTMSVMRGGELVQVSYKVYIPKKAPALARRKLQR